MMRHKRSADVSSWGALLYKLAYRVFAAGALRERVMHPASQSNEMLRYQQLRPHGTLPTFLAKAHEEDRVRQALFRLGYRRVLATYTWQRKNVVGTDGFYGLTREGLSPSLEFVGGWLKEERKRVHAAVRSTFLAAMLSAIGAGFVFVICLKLFR